MEGTRNWIEWWVLAALILVGGSAFGVWQESFGAAVFAWCLLVLVADRLP